MNRNVTAAPLTNLNRTGRGFGFDQNYHAALISIAILVIISNSLVIVLFVTKEKLRKGGKLLLLSLAISDVSTGLITIPLNISCEMTFSLSVCMTSGILNRFLAISTVYHILAITFETYYAILRPMEHRVKVEKQKILGIALAIWLGALIIAVTPLFWAIGDLSDIRKKPSNEFLLKMSIYEIVVITFGFLLPLSLMVFAHARMFSKILKALKLIRSSPPHKPRDSNKNKYKTAVLFAVILLVFTACWLFWFTLSLLKAAMGDVKFPFPPWAVDSLTIARYSTSFINPLLYTFFRPDFHTAFKATLLRRQRRRRPSVSLTYLLSGSSRTKRDSQTTTTMTREPSTAVPTMYVSTPQSPSKSTDKDTTV